jgi:hypothetical protein
VNDGSDHIRGVTVDSRQLQDAVEHMNSCAARLARSVPVKERLDGAVEWEGVVDVFEITGHPTATQAYAWSSPIEGSDKRRFFAVLHQPTVPSPVEAVRAAIVAEHKMG